MLKHHTLIAWQRADDLFIEIHRLTQKSLPRDERYELSSQLRRAAYSVPANIVEGYARKDGTPEIRAERHGSERDLFEARARFGVLVFCERFLD